MPNKSYPLEEGSPVEVDLAWRGVWKDFTVSVGGKELGRMNGQSEMKSGQSWTLDDGSELRVVLDAGFGGAELQVTRNGAPLPGSPSDPKARFVAVSGIAFFIAGLNILVGVAAEFGGVQFLLDMGMGLYSIIFGVIFLGLGFVIRKGSRVALIIAVVLFAIDGLMGVYGVVEAGGSPPIGGSIFRVFLIVAMAKPLLPQKTP